MAEYVEVVNAGPGWTEVKTSDGEVVRVEGNRNWRNNNPGNIEYGPFARSMGAIGTDGRFAVFPTYELGREAKSNLIFESPNYRDLPLSGAINRYAPPSENNTQSYINQVAQAAGISPNTPMNAITPEQRAAVLDAMQRVEGWKVGTVNGSAPANSATPLMAYSSQRLPTVGPTGGPALSAINAAAPQQQAGGFWSQLTNPVRNALGFVPSPSSVAAPITRMAYNPQVQQAAIGPLMGSLAGRNVLTRGLMNMNIGAAPTITPGAAGPGTRAVAVSNQGASPVMMTSNGGSGAASSGAHGNWNPDIYRANTAVLGSGGHNQASINNALSQGKTLYKLA